MRRAAFALVFLVPLAGADTCKKAATQECCPRSDGTNEVVALGACGDGSLGVIGQDLTADECASDQQDTDATSDDPCAAFCEAWIVACPEDTACIESCEHSTVAPAPTDIDCATQATDCSGDCWGFYTE